MLNNGLCAEWWDHQARVHWHWVGSHSSSGECVRTGATEATGDPPAAAAVTSGAGKPRRAKKSGPQLTRACPSIHVPIPHLGRIRFRAV